MSQLVECHLIARVLGHFLESLCYSCQHYRITVLEAAYKGQHTWLERSLSPFS